MGADNFTTRAKGTTATDAFRTAKDEAYYMHGHRGYTGTIADKNEFIEIPLPKDVDAAEFIHWVEVMDYNDYNPSEIPAQYLALVKRAYTTWKDKWGPAVAVKCCDGEYIFFGLASS